MKLRIDSFKYGTIWAYFDNADAENILKHRWTIQRKKDGSMYVATISKRHKITMHCFVMNDISIDHINGEGLDNRRCNLRKATSLQNSYNRGTNKNNKTGFKGVSKQGKWFTAQIHNNGVKIHIGLFDKAEDAAKAYDEKALEIHGEYAYLNFGPKPSFPDPNEHEEVFQGTCISSTGYLGVYKESGRVSGKMFYSKVKVDKKQIYLGYYETAREAAIAYDIAVDRYGFNRPKNNIE